MNNRSFIGKIFINKNYEYVCVPSQEAPHGDVLLLTLSQSLIAQTTVDSEDPKHKIPSNL